MFTPHRISAIIAILVIVTNLLTVSDVRADDRQLERERARQQEELVKAEQELARAREDLNRNRYEDAAERFARAYEMLEQETQGGDALYWEAFSRYRLSRTHELKRALELLQLQQARFPESATHVEGEALIARVYAELAERGEADAAREITARATEEEIREETRAAALQALMHMDPRKAMPVLKKIVLDRSEGNSELRQHAIMIMCHQGDEEAEEILIKLLEDETDTETISHVVMCLSMTGSDRSLQAIMKVFKETDDPEVSEAALMSIAQHSGDEVFDFLRDLAADKKRPTEMRAQALMALGHTGHTGHDEEITDLLVDVLKTAEDREIQEMALYSLAQQGSPAAREAIVEVLSNSFGGLDEEFQVMALHFAAQNGDIEMGTLRKMYQQTSNRDMKQQILHVLTMMDDQDAALDMLIEITSNETDPEIKRDAVFWIGQFDSDRAADYLMKVINE